MSTQRVRTKTFHSRPRNSTVDTGVEIREWEKPPKSGNTKIEGRVCLRFFISDGSKKPFKFILEPFEAFDIYHKIQKIARSQVACKEQTAPHTTEQEIEGKTVKVVASVTVEYWIKEAKSGYAIIGSRTIDGKNISFNVPLPGMSMLLYAGELLKALSIIQSWEITPEV